MDRRKFLLGVGGASIGTSALVGSNAISSIGADRGLTINVVEDSNAYLGLDSCPGSPNGTYATIDEHGRIVVEVDDNQNAGQGVNPNAESWLDDVFQLCNQGAEDVYMWIERDGDWPTLEGEPRVDLYTGARDNSLIGSENAQLVEVGDCICVGIAVNTIGLDVSVDELLGDCDMVLFADVDAPESGFKGSECTACNVVESDGTEDFLSIDSIDPAAFPTVEIEARVDTELGRDGELDETNFTVCEGDSGTDGSGGDGGSGLGGSSSQQEPEITANFDEEDSKGLADVMIVIDESGSMGGSKMDNAKQGAKDLVDALGPEAWVGLVTFGSGASLEASLGTPKSDVKSDIGSLTGSDFTTDMAAGVDRAQDELDANGREEAPNFMVVLGDGDVNAHSEAQAAKDSETTIYSIGYGSGVSSDFKDIASTPTDEFAFEADEADISEVFQDIGESISNTYVITYEACNDSPSGTRDVLLLASDPDEGDSTTTDSYTPTQQT